MIAVTINADEARLPDGATVVDAVVATIGRALDAEGRPVDGGRLGVAVAVDAEVVPRSAWSRTALRSGQSVEIVTAVQGG